MTKQNKAPFKVGDKVIPKHGDRNQVLTVLWVCKGNYDRDEQLIATERNDYCHPCSDACLFEEATQ